MSKLRYAASTTFNTRFLEILMTNSHHLVWPTNSHTTTLDHGAPPDIVTFVACQFKGFSSLYRQSEVQEQKQNALNFTEGQTQKEKSAKRLLN